MKKPGGSRVRTKNPDLILMTSEKFTRSGVRHPCPVCGRKHDHDCSIGNGMVFCHNNVDHKPGDVVGDWAFTKVTSDGRCGVFVPHKPLSKPQTRETQFFETALITGLSATTARARRSSARSTRKAIDGPTVQALSNGLSMGETRSAAQSSSLNLKAKSAKTSLLLVA